MAEYPALPLFTDAFLADTLHLNTVQIGAYMLMIMTAWRAPDCALPNDDIFLARICRMDRRTWGHNREVLLSFWHPDGARLQQKRLKDERNYVDQKRNINSANGKASALKRLNRGSTTVATNGQRKSNPHTHTIEREDKGKEPLPSLTRWQDFKSVYPKARAGSWQKAEIAYRAAIKRGFDEDRIYAGAESYANSDEVVRGFAKGAAAWLNDDRFTNDYSNGGNNGNANALTRGNSGQPTNAYRNQGGNRWPQRDDRDPATRARDEAERIIIERRERWAKEDADRAAVETQPGSAGTIDLAAISSLCEPADLRGQSRYDGISGSDVPARVGGLFPD